MPIQSLAIGEVSFCIHFLFSIVVHNKCYTKFNLSKSDLGRIHSPFKKKKKNTAEQLATKPNHPRFTLANTLISQISCFSGFCFVTVDVRQVREQKRESTYLIFLSVRRTRIFSHNFLLEMRDKLFYAIT